MVEGFMDICENCIKLDKEGQHFGCQFHRPNAQVWRKGNPNRSQICKNWVKGYKKKMCGFIEQGDSPLMPMELKALRTHLLSSGNIWDLQVYTMLLISCKLFLRSAELTRLQFDSENPDISIVKEGGKVVSLSFVVLGKADKRPITLTMWYDNDFPEFCPVRHLLLFLGKTGITSGYFFPCREFLSEVVMGQKSWDGCVPFTVFFQS
jgi:hypothetical protein